ncbi:MAG: glutamyl-tRNA synthetase [Verrucomicrobiales bacterium]
MNIGRYAPSPSGDLHVGNLRTAMLAWLSAKHHGGELRLRVDDLDPRVSTLEHEEHQRRDLDALGITFDGPELRQSERTAAYTDAIASLTDLGLVYRCFCSRREIREAASAPHVHLPDGAYPGTCRDLSPAQRIERAKDRPAALRVRTENVSVEFVDRNYGAQKELIDDFVIQRNDGVASYNLATVLDDAQQGVTEVVRGADLLVGTARHVWLREVLELPRIEHAHVPLIMNTAGERLAKRDGAVTMFDLASIGVKADDVRARLACSLNLSEPGEAPTMSDLLSRYDPTVIPLQPWIWTD